MRVRIRISVRVRISVRGEGEREGTCAAIDKTADAILTC